MKVCVRCWSEKDDCDFYDRDKSCKTCRVALVKEYRKNNERVRCYDRKRAKLPHRRTYSRSVVIRWRIANPDGYKAHSAANYALRNGALIKPTKCESCLQEKRLHAHHEDYSKPLEVKWLCARCHHRLHAGHALF